MEETEREEQLLVLVLTRTARERGFVHHLVEPLHVGLDTLHIVSWVSFMYSVVMCILVIVAPPIVVGAWSMAFLLRRHVKYYTDTSY